MFIRNHRQKIRLTASPVQSLIVGIILLASSPITRAAETTEKIFIEADHMQMNIETGKSIYTGNVKISQGEMVLTGDRVTLEQRDEELERLLVIGKPARYNHLSEKGEPIEAESEHMVYTTSNHTLIMTINAHLKQPDNRLSSQKIIYDTEKHLVMAGGSGNPSGTQKNHRVNIVLTPKEAGSEK